MNGLIRLKPVAYLEAFGDAAAASRSKGASSLVTVSSKYKKFSLLRNRMIEYI